MSTYMKVIVSLLGILGGLLILLIIIYAILLRFLFKFIFDRSRTKEDNERKPLHSPDWKYILKYDYDWLNSLDLEKVEMNSSYDNTKLIGHFLKSKSNNHNYIISVHGYRGSYKELSEQLHKIYANRDPNILMIEQRAHHESEGQYLTMGYKEKFDLLDWIRLVVKNDPDANICLYGLSMGAATVMMTVGFNDLPKNVKCAVEDCGFSSIYDQFKNVCYTRIHFPPFLILPIFSVYAKHRLHIDLKKDTSLDSLRKSNTPMLFIHGSGDDYVPYSMLNENYNALKEGVYKEKLVVNEANHALSYQFESERYIETFLNFYDKFIK